MFTIFLFWLFSNPAQAQERGQEFHLAINEAIALTDPVNAQTNEEILLASALFEGLTTLTPDTVEPLRAVAKDWTLASDKRTYLFFIREDASWNNGKRVEAEDFVAGWQRVLRRQNELDAASLLLEHINNTTSYFSSEVTAELSKEMLQKEEALKIEAEALADGVLKVTLSYPIEHFPYLLALPIFYPWPSWLKEESGKTMALHQLPSNGPFMWWGSTEADRIVLSKNPYYWGKRQMQIERVVMHVDPNPFTVLREFQEGNLDWTGTVNLAELGPAAWKGKRQVIDPGTRYYYYLDFMATSGIFSEYEVRRALSLAIPRDMLQKFAITHAIRGGVGFYPRGDNKNSPNLTLATSVSKAKQALATLGYCDATKPAEGCKSFPAVTIHFANHGPSKKLALGVCDAWSKHLGIPCNTIPDDDNKGAVDASTALRLGVRSPQLPLALVFLQQWSQQMSKALQLNLRELLSTPKAKLTQGAVMRLERRLVEEVPYIPLVEAYGVSLVSPRVQGFYKNRLDIHPLKHIYFQAGVAR